MQRYSRAARWFHALVYLTVLSALVTGWWFVLDGYHNPLLALPDTTIHELAGLALIVVTLAYCAVRIRRTGRFVRDSTTFRPGDTRWLAGWPRAAVTGRFRSHDGRYDPGQRIANLVMIGLLVVIALSGVAMLVLPDGGSGVGAFEIHRWAAYAVTPVLVGHIVIASGALPGYRGVWRSMHLGGRLPRPVAQRLWPGWTSRYPS